VLINIYQLGGCFWVTLTFELVNFEEVDCPSYVGGLHPNSRRYELNEKPGLSEQEGALQRTSFEIS
jgi:hypothetical protein